MLVISIILLIPLLVYSVQVIGWYIQWIRSDEYHPETDDMPGVSLIIPFKDEEANLAELMAALQQQSHSNWELILVNDHSTDNSLTLLDELRKDFKAPVTIIDSQLQGKKSALLEGVKLAQHDLIVTTDADCTFHADWLRAMASYALRFQPDLLIGPVAIKKDRGFLQRFQQIDFTALQISGAAAAMQQKAIMCNGANLLCKKELYLSAHLQPALASGDDMFLLEWMKSNRKSIHFIRSSEALVETNAITSLKAFLQQRARWAAKAPHYHDRHIISSGIVVALVNIVLFTSWIGGFYNSLLFHVFGYSVLIKSLLDYMLIRAGSYDYKLRITLFELVFWQLVYPFYVIIVLVFPLLFPVRWKGRKV
jgi:cellulose synthase/poly-beta-1,6-N-acetylglucosamine synthase-like glycosyltransferase